MVLGRRTTPPDNEPYLTLLCASHEGYANLCDLLTLAHRYAADSGDRGAPFLTHGDFEGKTEGLFCVSGGHGGPLQPYFETKQWSKAFDLVKALRGIFGDRFLIELTHHERPGDSERLKLLIEIANHFGIKTVASNAVRHATRAQYAVYDAQTCRRLGLTVAQWHPDRPKNAAAYLCSQARLEKLGLPPTALANSEAIARECSVALLPGEVAPPHAFVPSGSEAAAYLRELCTLGLKTRGLDRDKDAKPQLDKEMAIVCSLGLEEFFLVVREVVAYARSVGIRCSGRGSAANSLISYLLGITEVNPLQHGLLFERFLHEGRKGMPDIDVDFDSSRRGEVISWMAEHWGETHTAMTANINTYRLRGAVRDFGKVLGYPLPLLDRATKFLPHASVKQAFQYRDELAEVLGDGVALQTLLHLCTALHDGLESSPRHLSLHSGGMVLSRQPLRHLSPIQTSANGVRQMQFNKDDIERLGLIKFDILGLRMLSVICETAQLLESVGAKVPDVDALPEGDAKTYDMICDAQTLGVFQIESPGQWNLLARSQPRDFSDLCAQVALFRPGPLQGGMVHPYIARRRGWIEPSFLHKSLEKCLKDTFGVIVFQEQVLEVAHKFAGLSLTEADEFRRLMSRFRDSDEMESMRDQFVRSAIETHRDTPQPVSHTLANHIFDLVSRFVGYGFCRSHAAAFARIVYQSAYLKAHHPAAYMAGVLEHKPGFYPMHTILEEARAFGVTVLPPCILWSGVKYTLERLSENDLAIRIPFTRIKEFSTEAAAQIVLERSKRPFESLDDLYRRVTLKPEAWTNLARSGALDAFGTRREVLWHLGRLRKSYNKSLSMFDTPLELELPHDQLLMRATSENEETQWNFQTQSLTTGAHPIPSHPIALRRYELEKLGTLPIREIFKRPHGSTVRTTGIVISRQRPPTAKGFCFLIIEDETGRLPTALQPNLYSRFERVLRQPSLIIEGQLEAPPEEKYERKDVYRSILIEKIWSIDGLTPRRKTLGGAEGFPCANPRLAVRVK